MERRKITPVDVRAMKKAGKRITMLTAYDYPTAMLEDRAGIDIILVGDSLAMTVLGYENTLPVTMDEMISHTKAVVRGAKIPLIIGDMPFMSYNTSEREAIANAGRFLKEGGADAIKLEGGVAVQDTVRAIVRAGVPVMGLSPSCWRRSPRPSPGRSPSACRFPRSASAPASTATARSSSFTTCWGSSTASPPSSPSSTST